jgi:hypothetical protein
VLSGGGVPVARGTKALLTASDFTYLGIFKPPALTVGMGFSRGVLTGRRVGAETRIFQTCVNSLDDVVEYVDPGSYSLTLGTAPTATVSRYWGEIYGSPSKRWQADDGNGGPWTWGLKWYDGKLYWTYCTPYEGTNWNPSLGVSVLNDDTGAVTAYGPWRATVFSGLFNATMTEIPAWFQTQYGITHPLLQIAGVHCQIGSSPCGLVAQAFTPVAYTSTPDPVETQTTRSQTVLSLSNHDVTHRMARPLTGYKVCSSEAILDAEPYFTGQQTGTPSANLDWIDSGVWIDTPTKTGVLCFAQLSDSKAGFTYTGGGSTAHCWYGGATCAHGQEANQDGGSQIYAATGPACPTVLKYALMIDPAEFGKVILGQQAPEVVPYAQAFTADTLGLSDLCRARYENAGIHFDSVTSKLYVSQVSAWNGPYEPAPVIHVFSVS